MSWSLNHLNSALLTQGTVIQLIQQVLNVWVFVSCPLKCTQPSCFRSKDYLAFTLRGKDGRVGKAFCVYNLWLLNQQNTQDKIAELIVHCIALNCPINVDLITLMRAIHRAKIYRAFCFYLCSHNGFASLPAVIVTQKMTLWVYVLWSNNNNSNRPI